MSLADCVAAGMVTRLAAERAHWGLRRLAAWCAGQARPYPA